MEIRRRTIASGSAAAPVLTGVSVALGRNEPGLAIHPDGSAAGRLASFADIVPAPVFARPDNVFRYTLTPDARIFATSASSAATEIAEYLAAILRRSTGYGLPVGAAPATNGKPGPGIWLLLTGADPIVGEEGYQLDLTAEAAVIRARRPAGLFAGVQTLRQLLPSAVERDRVQPGPWQAPGGRIVDYPRFAYRSAMLDVARHFFPLGVLKRYVDQLTLYKINHLHLHLSDDQGWRLMINRWPRLAEVGGSTAVGGDPGGFYTQEDYRELVAYAERRYITVVPEIDMPGHVNAALTAYPELACTGTTPKAYTGIEVGFSSLCVEKDITYRFVDDVLGELADLTPGPYLHIGGDEADATSPEAYGRFMTRVQGMVAAHGKSPLAWHQIVGADLLPSTVAQYWDPTPTNSAVAAAASNGTKLVLSPASRSYLDMKYTKRTGIGLHWAGHVEVRDAYGWDPGAYLKGVADSSVIGVEAPLWTETVRTVAELEYLAFPRLPAVAELGWSQTSAHDWDAFRGRLAAQGPRWTAMGLNFYKSPQVAWPG